MATFLDDPDHFMGLYMDPGNAWGNSDDVAYLDAYAKYNLGMSAEELLFSTYGYLDPFELRTARTQFLLGNEDAGNDILKTATTIAGEPGTLALAGGGGARFTPNQDALIQLAKEAKQLGSVTYSEAQILQEWAKEYSMPYQPPRIHPNRNFNVWHIHIGSVDHIPLK